MSEDTMIEKLVVTPIWKGALIAAACGLLSHIFTDPKHALGAAAAYGVLTLFFWYPAKAVLITLNTILTWKSRYPGEPMFRAGGLTEYDQERCRRTGEAMADALRKHDRK